MTETATYRELRRSRTDRMLGGVCGGLGAYFNVNPAFYRVGFVVLALLGGAGIVIYGACLLVIPNDGEHESIATDALRNHRHRPAALVGLVLVAFAGIALLSHITFRVDNDLLWLVVLAVGAAILWSSRRESAPPATLEVAAGEPTPPQPRPRRVSLFPFALGALVALFGVFGILMVAGVDVPWALALGAAAVVTGIAVVAGAIKRMRVGGVAALGILLALAAVAAASIHLHLDDGIGDRTYTPAGSTELHRDYRLGVGELEIDLANMAVPPGETRIEAHVGIGHLKVIVPRGVTVHAVGHADYGQIDFPNGLGADGRDVSSEFGPAAARLLIDAHVGAGRIEVVRAVS